jgi:excinuclease UvrABC nuclease subunit
MINITIPEPEKMTTLLMEIEEKGGIYLLYDSAEKLLYIGQSDNLWYRIGQQLDAIPYAKSFRVVYIDDPYEREIYETAMINALKPSNNKAKVFYKK